MGALLKEESTISVKGQTTIPKAVRQALGVEPGDRIAFTVDEHRRVYLEKVKPEQTSDPVIDSFLGFLANDMSNNPGTSVVSFPQALLDRAVALTAGMSVDLDAEIEGDIAI
ncbi:antitoxin PrlF [Rhizobium sp. PP-F2F-G20b]|nr:antitoxin PrlF [Rhizobium sp. PP-F2F-G20b]